MTIHFNCPYCTAPIKVADNAAGKKGTCLQCGTKLLVPVPKNMPQEQTAPLPQPMFTTATNFAPPPAPVFVPQQAEPKHNPPSTNTSVLVLVIVALVIGVGFMVYSWNKNESLREGIRRSDQRIKDFNRILRGE